VPASLALHPAAKPRNRSIEARRAARRAKFERERLIVDSLNRGVAVAEIAERIGVTEKRMRALVHEILARRMPAAPEDFAALQVSRLNQALLIAYGAMSAENLKAVALVVRIVRELDRHHGFVAAGRRPRGDPGADAEARERSPDTASEREQALVPAPPQDREPTGAPPADRPEMAPQALEKIESAPEKRAAPNAREAAPRADENAGSARRDGVGAKSSNEALPPAAAPRSEPASAGPCAGAEMAPQTIENIESAPGNGGSPAEAEPADGPSAHADAFARSADAPGPASGAEHSLETVEVLYPVASVLVPDSGAPGGFRRVNIRMLPNGMAVC
jgi:hypothetical protein